MHTAIGVSLLLRSDTRQEKVRTATILRTVYNNTDDVSGVHRVNPLNERLHTASTAREPGKSWHYSSPAGTVQNIEYIYIVICICL